MKQPIFVRIHPDIPYSPFCFIQHQQHVPYPLYCHSIWKATSTSRSDSGRYNNIVFVYLPEWVPGVYVKSENLYSTIGHIHVCYLCQRCSEFPRRLRGHVSRYCNWMRTPGVSFSRSSGPRRRHVCSSRSSCWIECLISNSDFPSGYRDSFSIRIIAILADQMIWIFFSSGLDRLESGWLQDRIKS